MERKDKSEEKPQKQGRRGEVLRQSKGRCVVTQGGSRATGGRRGKEALGWEFWGTAGSGEEGPGIWQGLPETLYLTQTLIGTTVKFIKNSVFPYITCQ